VDSYAASGDHFTYVDAGVPAKAVAQQLVKWIDEARGDRNDVYSEQENRADSTEPPLFWKQRLDAAKQELAGLIPKGTRFILIDQNVWGPEILTGRGAIPFIERDGVFWGPPGDDDTAIREFERLRGHGASFIVFLWPSFWWLDYYAEFARHLNYKCQCVLQSERAIVFDMR
jgi:hypothetical protein